MRYTQNEIITRISEKTHYTPNTIKDVLVGCQEVLIELLKFKPKEDMLIELWDGFRIKRYYEAESKFVGALQNLECTEKIKIKPVVTQYFKQKINKELF